VTASFVPAASPRKQDHQFSRFATGATGLLLGATGEATRAARATQRYRQAATEENGGGGGAAASTCPTGTRAELPRWRTSRPLPVRLPSTSAIGTWCQAGRWRLL